MNRLTARQRVHANAHPWLMQEPGPGRRLNDQGLPSHGRTPEVVPRPAARKKVLVITFHYPPDNTSSGGLRPLKFTKYLPQFGWASSVLTVREACYASTDPAQLRDIPPHTKVYRSRGFDTKRVLSVGGRYPAWLAVPDRYVSWVLFGAIAAARIVRRERVEALISTSPVPSAHLIALLAQRWTQVPWIADFRDPWVETEGSEVYGALRQSLELRLERRVVSAASRVSVTTREFGDYLRRRYAELPRDKIVPVYNGYDEDDFTELRSDGLTEAKRDFTLVHAGLLDAGYRNPAPLFAAVRRCLDRGNLPRNVRIEFLGGGPFTHSEAFARLVADSALQDTVRVVDRVPYRQALASLASAGVLLLLQAGDDTKMLIPAKAFEYLRSGRPVATLAPEDSATARLVREFDGTFVADPNDAERLHRGLAELFARWSAGARNVDRQRQGLARYSRREATRQLAGLLDQVVMQG